jgi:hypothetical protein
MQSTNGLADLGLAVTLRMAAGAKPGRRGTIRNAAGSWFPLSRRQMGECKRQ